MIRLPWALGTSSPELVSQALRACSTALRVFHNKTAAQANTVNGWYNPKSKAKGPADFVKRYNITKVTPQMIAYAALQVPSTTHCI